ncbi:MAG: carboxymuconolactone decarboxylase family protein [Deltaproteobacteria bacterium]|nr:carboxymuconolactone decarboxylase family protein [Deltaproteobacteria bacterium]
MRSWETTAGRDELGDFAPEFARLNDDVLFGEVWSRGDRLSARDRSLVTVAALLAAGNLDSSLSHHLSRARENGVARAEIAEAITHLAFYAGWPRAWAAFRLAMDIWPEGGDVIPFSPVFPIGEPNEAYSRHFAGRSHLKRLAEGVFNVTFEPGCRNDWHAHTADSGGGQVLLCTDGRGWFQERGRPPRKLGPGDAVTVPCGAEHWHGAAGDSWFAHLAVEVPGENAATVWLEPVNEEDYGRLA